MSRPRPHPVEPNDLPLAESEAISTFSDTHWGEDAKWLGPLALSILQGPEETDEDTILSEPTKYNLQLIAKANSAAHYKRDQAMLMAFVRLCGCGGLGTDLRRRPQQQTLEGDPLAPPATLEQWRSLAQHLRMERPHAKGADLEGALASSGWPGDYDHKPDTKSTGLFGVHAPQMLEAEVVKSFDHSPLLARLMHLLVDVAGLDLARVICDRGVMATGLVYLPPDPDELLPLRVPAGPDLDRHRANETRSLSNWMFGLGPRTLTLFFPAFAERKDHEHVGLMALGVRYAIESWLHAAGHLPSNFVSGGSRLAQTTRPYFDVLHARCTNKELEPSLAARRAWLWFARCTFAADPDQWKQLNAEAREAVLQAANEDLSRLRKLLARAKPRPLIGSDREIVLRQRARTNETLPPLQPSDFTQGHGHLLPADVEGPIEGKQRTPWEEFEWEKDHAQICLNILFSLGGVWRGLKPMLLAWRALSTPGVARDLRYWPEEGREPAPAPWADLFAWPINLFHVFAAREMEHDPELVLLRSELGQFCLDRLVDRLSKKEREQADSEERPRRNEDMVERSPDWRYCLIRAFGSLGVNPEGKGHRVVRMASQFDPEPRVREAARQGYEKLRRNVGLPDDVSPRRAIMSALWWVRQAHLLGLEIQPDPDGAQRTRIKELARTKEIERHDKPATHEKS